MLDAEGARTSTTETFLAGNSLGRAGSCYRVVLADRRRRSSRLCTRMTIEGREHLPTTGAFVLAPVHRSYIDTPIAACVTRRRLRFMGKDSLWNYRQFGWLLLGARRVPGHAGHRRP